MKLLAIFMLSLTAISSNANNRISAFNHWGLVAIVDVTNGKVATTILHCLPGFLKVEERGNFDKEVTEWAAALKDQSFVYAMCFQDGNKKSSTWNISRRTYEELSKIALIAKDADLKPEHE